ncbi:MAG: glutaminase A [Beijerinckiaceae bacterium]|nr:glutaminase A [Beijerinckiaceae bacterium]
MASPEDPVSRYLAGLRAELLPIDSGALANYIPELAKANPGHLAIAIATMDGRVYFAGDAAVQFTIQSVSKPFAFAHALACHGRAAVLKKVGVEPTGDPFNSIVLDDAANRPYNPMVNAGAIAVAELFPGDTTLQRAEAMREALSRFAGRALEIDEAVFRSERETGHRNRAIAYLMRNSGMIAREPEEVLEVYFKQCSLLVNCKDLAIMAASLANNGVNPLTGEPAMPGEYGQDVLTVMHSCGMYDYAGQWSHEVGIPAKSGVSGCVIAAVPGQIGIAAYSPKLDTYGNSVRAVMACLRISADFGLHVFRSRADTSVFRHEIHGLRLRSKRVRTPAEREVLGRSGGAVSLIEAQGNLYFSTAERLVNRVRELAANGTHIIIDFRHVFQADSAAARMLQGLKAMPSNPRCRLVFSHLPAAGPLANLYSALSAAGGEARDVAIFDKLDAALENVENEILITNRVQADDSNLSLSQIAIFQGLDAGELQLLTESVAPSLITFEAGHVIIRQGELGKTLFAVVRGSASVILPSIGTGGRDVRLASIGKGLTFGELAVVEGRPRGAQITAESDLICYAVSIGALRAFGQIHPVIYVKILLNIIRDLADTLRFSNEAIRALER